MGIADRTYSEKRGFIRMTAKTKVLFSLPGSTDIHQGKSQDLSGNGLNFVSDIAITPGTQLKVKICPPTDSTPSLEGTLHVIRVDALGNDQYAIGGSLEI